MIADKNLQIASAFDANAACTTTGYLQTADSIDATQLRDLGAGQPVYAKVTIRSGWSASAPCLVVFAARAWTNYPSTALGFSTDNNVFEYLIPRIGISEPVLVTELTAGKVLTFPINCQALTTSNGIWEHDARGMRYVFGTATIFDITTPGSLAFKTPESGTFDFDFVLSPSAGVRVAGANKQSEGPFYPTAITQV